MWRELSYNRPENLRGRETGRELGTRKHEAGHGTAAAQTFVIKFHISSSPHEFTELAMRTVQIVPFQAAMSD